MDPGKTGTGTPALQIKRKMLERKRDARRSGFDYRNPAILGIGAIFKTPCYLLNDISMITHWQDYCGKDNSRSYQSK